MEEFYRRKSRREGTPSASVIRHPLFMLPLVAFVIFLAFPCLSFAQEIPEIFVQLGHRSSDVHAAAFSSDGRHLATGSGDRTVKLWNLATGAEIRTYPGHPAEVTAVAISSDNRQILSGDQNGNIKLWDAESGREIKSMVFSGKERAIKALRFSQEDGFFSSLTPGTLTVWESRTGKPVRQIERIRGGYWYDRGDAYLAATSGDLTNLALLDSATGRVIKSFKCEDPWFIHVSFSQNGEYALFMREEYTQKKQVFSLFDIEAGRTISSWHTDTGQDKRVIDFVLSRDGRQAITAGGGGLTLWDALQGKPLKVLTTSSTFFVHLSHDGRFLLSSGLYAPTLWDTASGSILRSFRQRPLSKSSFAQYQPQGKQLLINRSGAPPLLLDAATGGVDRVLHGYTGGYFGAGGRYLMLADEKEARVLFDLEQDKIARIFQGKHVRLSKDERLLVEKIGEREFRIWETAAGRETLRHLEPSGEINNFAVSHDNRHLVLCVDNGVKLVDIAAGSESRAFVVRETTAVYGAQTSMDGRFLVALCRDDRTAGGRTKCFVKIWDVASGREIAAVYDVRSMLGFQFSPDGETLLVGSHTDKADSVALIDLATGRRLRTFTGQDTIWEMAFSDDGRLLATGDADGSILLWDAATGERKISFAGHKNGVRTVRFSPDLRRIVSTGDDGPARFWDIATGKEIARFISFTDGEWITIAPEGYFNASGGGAKHLNVRVGNQVYSIDNFYEKFFDPVHVASVLQGKKVEAAVDIRKGVLPPPQVRILSPGPGEEFSTDILAVTVSAKDTGGGIDEIRLYHNDKAVGEEQRAIKVAPSGPETLKTYTVVLVDGINTFRAVGFSRDRTESNPDELVVKLAAPSKEVDLHIFAVGINVYKNPALNLNYAQPDAQGITAFFRRKGKGLFKNVEITEIYNEQASKENITSKLGQLQDTRPQDAVLIYLAGHGESIDDKWFFIPHELTFPERESDLQTKGISSEELSEYIKNIRAQKVLVLIDACKSGAVVVAFRGFEDRKALYQLSRSTGVHVIAASTKDQFAAEVKELGHGVFTYTLLEGLAGKAAAGGQTVTVLKLKAYLDEYLPEITQRYRQEAQYPVGDTRGMDFPLATVR
ncbi:MAG: caspase family protein [Desulfobacterales bacterium]|nr:caspase family protein [Desulfobacterales bacterium]